MTLTFKFDLDIVKMNNHARCLDIGLLSFLLFCGEMLPSALRPQVGPMHNPTSPNGLESLRGFCKLQTSSPMHLA